jgi:hypothetical protein
VARIRTAWQCHLLLMVHCMQLLSSMRHHHHIVPLLLLLLSLMLCLQPRWWQHIPANTAMLC